MAATHVRDAGSIALAVAVTIALLGAGSVPGHATSGGRPVLAEAATPTCDGTLPPQGVAGTFSVEGGPVPPSAAGGVVLEFSYTVAYHVFDLGNSSPTPLLCAALSTNVTTATGGSFGFVPAIPAPQCVRVSGLVVCTEYATVAAGPLTVRIPAGVPPGYDLETSGSPRSLSVALVYPWEAVSVAPGGPVVTMSVGLPTALAATVLAGNGSATGLPTAFLWSVNGTGWAVDGPLNAATIQVEALAGAGTASARVVASTTVNASTFLPLTAMVQLVGVATEIETAALNRTAVDAGETVAADLSATGAAGVSYVAQVQPGLGLAPVPATCSSAPPAAGTVALSCSANIAYPAAGTAQPTATISNGYSTASWRFPDVTVTPAPQLELVGAAPVGYVGVPISVAVMTANGSGALPFSEACLAGGAGPADCFDSGGPSWTFEPTYPLPGNFTAVVWAHDAGGTNASLAFTVRVVPSLAVGTIALVSGNATVGAAAQLRAEVDGGVLPARYWWNASAASSPVGHGELSADGTLGATFVPTAAGPVVVTLTVVDTLGTVAVRQLVVVVGPASAVRVAAVTVPGPAAAVAGTPVALSWGAFLSTGSLDRTFSATAELNVTTPDGPPTLWVNASGAGSLVADGPDEFEVPASAWVGGVLNLTVAVATAAEVTIALSGAGLPSVVAPVGLEVVADREHVRLFDPVIERAGGRTNATLWRVEDPYGNPAPGALLSIALAFGGSRSTSVVAALALAPNRSGVWVNYSAPTAAAGVVTVEDAAGAVVLGPLPVPAAAAAPTLQPAVTTTATVVPVGAAGLLAVVLARRRRRRLDGEAADGELRALAQGRTRTVTLVGEAGAIDLAGLEAAWRPPPAPPALVDWLASLVADGTLRATLGNDGRARFCLADGPASHPRVTVDPATLEASLRRREDELGPPDGPED